MTRRRLGSAVATWIAGILVSTAAPGQVVIKTGIFIPVVVWSKVAAILPERGPQVSFELENADYTLGFVGREWPIAVDYRLEEKGFLTLCIKTEKNRDCLYVKGGKGKRKLEVLEVPETFTKKPVPAQLVIAAFTKKKGKGERVGVEVFGLGVGKRAVGSLAIERAEFGPGPIVTGEGTTAPYSFLPKEDFDHARVELLHAAWDDEEGLITTVVKSEPIDCPRKRVCGDHWDGRDVDGRPSAGQHLMQVRAWFNGPKAKKEWTFVRSADRVMVDPP